MYLYQNVTKCTYVINSKASSCSFLHFSRLPFAFNLRMSLFCDTLFLAIPISSVRISDVSTLIPGEVSLDLSRSMLLLTVVSTSLPQWSQGATGLGQLLEGLKKVLKKNFLFSKIQIFYTYLSLHSASSSSRTVLTWPRERRTKSFPVLVSI